MNFNLNMIGMAFPVLDIVVIAVLLLFSLIGVWKGFLRSLVSLCGFAVSFVVAILIRVPVANLFDKMFGLTNVVAGKIAAQLGAISTVLTDTKTLNAGELATAVDSSSLSGILKQIFKSFIGTENFAQPMSVADIVGTRIGFIVTCIVAVIVMFVIIRIIVFLLNLIIKKIMKKSAFGPIDKVLGFVLGLAKGGILVFIMFAGISLVSLIPSVAPKIDTMMTQTTISKYGYDKVNELIIGKLGIDKTKSS
ncbi:MAG: CvpA family protein [Clostridia bacterium]